MVKTPEPVKGQELREYFLEHAEPVPGYQHNGEYRIYKVTKPLYVFKLCQSAVIVNLVIPVGALIHVGQWAFDGNVYIDSRKMRASVAMVHSLFTFEGAERQRAASAHDSNFWYSKGRVVKPKYPFYMGIGTCESGIHFFLNVNDAVNYDV